MPDQGLGKRVRASSLRTDGWKLVRDSGLKSQYLYDLTRDAFERHNVIDKQPKESDELKQLLERWMRKMEGGSPETPRQTPSAETIRRLRSLGYIR